MVNVPQYEMTKKRFEDVEANDIKGVLINPDGAPSLSLSSLPWKVTDVSETLTVPYADYDKGIRDIIRLFEHSFNGVEIIGLKDSSPKLFSYYKMTNEKKTYTANKKYTLNKGVKIGETNHLFFSNLSTFRCTKGTYTVNAFNLAVQDKYDKNTVKSIFTRSFRIKFTLDYSGSNMIGDAYTDEEFYCYAKVSGTYTPVNLYVDWSTVKKIA